MTPFIDIQSGYTLLEFYFHIFYKKKQIIMFILWSRKKIVLWRCARKTLFSASYLFM